MADLAYPPSEAAAEHLASAAWDERTTTLELTIAERVAAGAAWLDQHAPGWVAQIDLSSFDIEEPCYCVLGQVYGHYFRSPRDARMDDASEYISDVRGFNGSEEDMLPLNAAWRALVEDRWRVTDRG